MVAGVCPFRVVLLMYALLSGGVSGFGGVDFGTRSVSGLVAVPVVVVVQRDCFC